MTQPNLLLILADQLSAGFLPSYGHPVVKAPNISQLGERGVLFEHAYCNSPLCGPSRASLATGCLPSRIGAFDNASDFPASTPTFAHYLRLLGYRTCLSGKMHFVGPDQLHGFEERLTTDIYPADFGWVPDWREPEKRFPWSHDSLSVSQAGACATSNQLAFDDEVGFRAVRKIYELALDDDDDRPFCLVASFSHPHDPYAITREYWDAYRDEEIDLPLTTLPPERLDPHSRRLRRMCGLDELDQSVEQVRSARRAYYGMISYLDAKVGDLLTALRETGAAEDTIVLFTADHGEMLGERGLWYKMSFFEPSMRVPLIVHAPQRFPPARCRIPVSLVDLLPTLVELGRGDEDDTPEILETDGHSLLPLLSDCVDGTSREGVPVLAEMLGEGAAGPQLMIRRGDHKFIHGPPDPDQLFDLVTDPAELDDLARRPEHADLVQAFREEVAVHWDVQSLRQEVLASQRRRRLVDEALRRGGSHSWDYEPPRDASGEYIRNHLGLADLERRARLPVGGRRPARDEDRDRQPAQPARTGRGEK